MRRKFNDVETVFFNIPKYKEIARTCHATDRAFKWARTSPPSGQGAKDYFALGKANVT
jgi:hypothetical protein